MKQHFQGWEMVAQKLQQRADELEQEASDKKDDNASRLNNGQRASLRAIATRIVINGVLIADEVGMGKTRIAVEVAHCVMKSGGRVAIVVPPGLGYQWQRELRDGGIHDVQPVVRSISSYLAAWDEEDDNRRPWFDIPTVMVSHTFSNWRFGENAHSWRWSLLPEIYARWRAVIEGRLPRHYHEDNNQDLAFVAESICGAVPEDRNHPVRKLLQELLNDVAWPRPRDPEEYAHDGDLRDWLERSFGFGLGVFDLIIIDEAHKSRGTDSGLSRVLGNVIVPCDKARRLALTATPVELSIDQWNNTLTRLGLDEDALARVAQATQNYAEAVNRVRLTWRSNPEARAIYTKAAADFQRALSPYLLRRDKREESDVKRFHDATKLSIGAYRKETAVLVDTNSVPQPWRKAICAAEALSLVTRQAEDSVAKRLRLTLGNGHGVAVFLDSRQQDEEDSTKEESDGRNLENKQSDDIDGTDLKPEEAKCQERGHWWLDVLRSAFGQGDDSLFDHPAILETVKIIEEATKQGEKVLVFGRYIRPLRALVDLLNAREMLCRVLEGKPWPQEKVHDDGKGNSEWPAVHAAHRQVGCDMELGELNEHLRIGYDRERYQRERFRSHLIAKIYEGLRQSHHNIRLNGIFEAFKHSIDKKQEGEQPERHTLSLVARAMTELLENPSEATPSDYAESFRELIEAVTDREDADDDREITRDEAAERWATIEERLKEEYSRTQGGFARIMYGNTSLASRRMIQLAFNRPNSFPKVLVAQSTVGREGLNLHKACRIVVILHPEWNPGVVEQQIGRVDRVGSHWCKKLNEAILAGIEPDHLPRIEVRPVVFQGTYDEHNWKVLHRRWNDLRAQLHGIVIPPSEAPGDQEGRELIEEIAKAAPNFSPAHESR